MNKERLTNLKQILQRNKEFTTLDVIEQLEQQIEKMKNCDNCKNLIQCTNRRYEKMTSDKMTMIRFPCCWELAE